uniref:Claudin n=1 Tax=Xenopus tropicalis TaxID=8364 RepID=A0A803KCL1_XENTR
MACFLVRIIGVLCGSIGMILTWIITLMPQWRISVIAENNGQTINRIDGQWISRFDGLWITCVNNGHMSQQCNGYDSVVSLTTDLKAGRVLMSFAVTLTFLGFLFSFVGMLMSQCVENTKHGKRCLLLTSGIFYILSVILIIIPVSWTIKNIISHSCDSIVCRGALRIELGEALFLAWPTVAFLLIGGIIMCWVCPFSRHEERGTYAPPRDQEMVCRTRQIEEELSSCNDDPPHI